jgi:dihydrolipoamide dehydrogenase
VETTLSDATVVETDRVLVAVGRRPRLAGLGLEEVGLADGPIEVDGTFRSISEPWLYAVGDVNGIAMYTHAANAQARVAAEAIIARASDHEPPGGVRADGRTMPRIVFTTPEVAAVGHTEASARAAGLGVGVHEFDLGRTAAAAARGGPGPWLMKVITEGMAIVGATIVAPHASEMIHAATVAIVGRVPLGDLRQAVGGFPTFSEAWWYLLDGIEA